MLGGGQVGGDVEGAVGEVGEGEEVGGAVDDVGDGGCVDEEGLGG